MVTYPYCNRTECFGNCKNNGYSSCKILAETYDRNSCKYFKTIEQVEEERKQYDKNVPKIKIIRSSSGLMYYS
jgi:hypothetical protein